MQRPRVLQRAGDKVAFVAGTPALLPDKALVDQIALIIQAEGDRKRLYKDTIERTKNLNIEQTKSQLGGDQAYRGWVKVRYGDIAEGISLLRDGTAAFRVTRSELFATFLVILLAHVRSPGRSKKA